MAQYQPMPGMQTPYESHTSTRRARPGVASYNNQAYAHGAQAYGYGAQAYGYGAPAYAPAPAPKQMTKEEKIAAKEARKQEKLLVASERCEKMRKKMKEQGKKDAGVFLIMMSIAYLGLGTLLGLTIIGPSWGSKEFTGIGAGLVMLRTSLFNLHIDISCDKSLWFEMKLCEQMMKPFEGDHDMQRAQGNSCSFGALFPSACDVLNRCYIASIPLFGCIAVCVLCSYAAAFCLFSYSKAVADPALRLWAGCFTLATPLLATTGIVTWALLMPDLGEIPRSWSTLADGLGAGGIIGHEETRDFQFGWTFFGACIIDLFMIVSAFVWMCMFKRSDGEEDVIREKAADRAFCDELEADRGKTMTYGATAKSEAVEFAAQAVESVAEAP